MRTPTYCLSYITFTKTPGCEEGRDEGWALYLAMKADRRTVGTFRENDGGQPGRP